MASVLDLARKASDLPANFLVTGLLVFGDSGAGKTHYAVADREGMDRSRPLVLALESNGAATIKRANSEATVLLVDEHDQPPLSIVRDVVRGLIGGSITGFSHLVIDSMTELQQLFKDELIAKKNEKKRRGRGRNEEQDEDGMSIKDWGDLTGTMRGFYRTLRRLPIPVVAVALADRADDGKRIVPSFQGRKIGAESPRYFNAVCYIAKRQIDSGGSVKIHRRTMFSGPERFVLKEFGALVGSIDPEEMSIIDALAEIQG